jgi:starch-binding outer membrane protein, SusD/RagB family
MQDFKKIQRSLKLKLMAMKIIYNKPQAAYIKLLMAFFILVCSSCKKDWLEAKPNLSLVAPTTISDYQALLDNTTESTGAVSVGGNVGFNVEQIFSNEIGAGDFYVKDANFNAVSPNQQNLYTWSQDIYPGLTTSSEWNTLYKKIYYTNIVSEGIEKIKPVNNSEQAAWNQVKGSALFFRAYNHFEVSQLYCKPFDKTTASSDLGIPLRLESDINISSVRSTVQQTYDAITNDLKLAKDILPIVTPNSILYKLRPTRNAATAMLARVYLSMSNYDSAFKYADQALKQYDQLMDYNTDIKPSPYYIPRFNPEVIFHTIMNAPIILSLGNAIADSNLYNLYEVDDKRRSAFFFNLSGQRFVGSYNQNSIFFSGLATDEIYLIRAECYARSGNKDAALTDLNMLMIKRWKNNGTWVPFTAIDANDALGKILTERRKELCFRGIRWSDLRRLNKEQRFAVTLTRVVNAKIYTLPPNDPRYVLPIPPDVILLSGIQQNPR